MKRVAVLQARTGSVRLPAKVLLPIQQIPLVVLAAKRAANTGIDVIVATSLDESDDALVAMLEQYQLSYYRGELQNTLARVVGALSDYDDETIVFRLTADNVFPDGALLDEIAADFIARDLSYLACNGIPSGLPYGMSAEVMYLQALREAAEKAQSAFDQEHVTPYIVRKYDFNGFKEYSDKKAGVLRSTIDCLDDYLRILNVFADVDDPVSVSSFELLDRLQISSPEVVVNKPVTRLVLGTAQLGMNYGIANESGKPEQGQATAIIKNAIANGVEYLDTANAYGNSEQVIGSALANGWRGRAKVITKLSPLADCPQNADPEVVKAFVDASIFASCRNLQVRELDVLMLHRAEHFSAWGGAVWQRLLDFKAQNIIHALGVSVQRPDELEQALSFEQIEYIQMPFNILDWRWQDVIPQIKEVKQKRNLTIHVRSALLQGLLVSKDEANWQRANVMDSETAIAWLNERAKSHHRQNNVDLCLAYVNGCDWVDGIALGMESLEQLHDNLYMLSHDALASDEIDQMNQFRPQVGLETLNPAMWN